MRRRDDFVGTTARRALLLLVSLAFSSAKRVDYERDAGAVADADDFDTLWANGAALNASLNGLSPGDSFVVPNKTFYLMGGIIAKGLRSVTIIIDGTKTCRVPRDATTGVGGTIKRIKHNGDVGIGSMTTGLF